MRTTRGERARPTPEFSIQINDLIAKGYLPPTGFPTVKLHDVLEGRMKLSVLLVGMGVLVLILDIVNPFTEFYRTWNIVYVLANFPAYLAALAPAYIVLGFLVEREDTAKLFFSSLWIPIVQYLLKGFLFLYMINEDPGLLVSMGSDIGWGLHDWRDFSIFYYGSFPIFIVTVWAFSVIFMVLGVFINFSIGDSIRKIFRGASDVPEDE